MMNAIGWFKEVGISGLLDICFMSFALYVLLVWSKKTRAASVLTGIMIVAGVYLMTRQLNMVLASTLLEKFFAIILIALVVIFQEELRGFFEQIAEWSLGRKIRKGKPQHLSREETATLVKTLVDLAGERVGALIVIRGKDLIVRHLDGGICLEGKVSEALLKSLFDASSIGHDGAVYIEGDKIIRFSCHLPLSKNLKKVGKGGTRHAAALGISELSDALCLVVSEERGTISVAHYGKLEVVTNPEKLGTILEDFYEAVSPRQKVAAWRGFLKKNYREKLIGLGLACLIWFVLVYGAKQTYETFKVPVTYPLFKEELVIAEIKPDKVYVTLSGPRNAFFFLSPNKIGFQVRPEAKEGNQKVRIYPSDFEFPKELTMEVLAPQEIEIRVEAVGGEMIKKDQTPEKGFIRKFFSILPLVDGEQGSSKPVRSLPKATSSDLSEQNEAVSVVQKVEKVAQLEAAKPEEVVKYLEKQYEDSTDVETLNLNGPDRPSLEKD